jgi:hypothetical protein
MRSPRELTILASMQDREPLLIETLVSEDDRRDADPILDHVPALRSKVDADRLLRTLDELEKEAAQ